MTSPLQITPIKIAADEYPDRLAFDDGKVQITYGQLPDKLEASPVMRIAGLQPGDHVAWCPQNDWDGFLTFWALQQLGCVACPISHRFPDAQRQQIVKYLDAKWLPDLTAGQRLKREQVPSSLDRPTTIVLSSGSTGIPKAVVHTMAAHVASAKGAAVNMPLDPGDRWLWSLPLFHVSGLSILVRCAVAGATAVCLPDGSALDGEVLDRLEVTHLSVVITQLRQLLSEDDFPSRHLKSVLLGGSGFDETMVIEARKRGVPVHTTYGLTEMASQVTTSSKDDPPHTSGRVLSGRELKINASGEILVRGETLCSGYYRDGQVHSAIDDQGWFHTRDLGDWDGDQCLTVKGRIDNMFFSGGENIHPERIERAMMNAFDIDQVIVVPKQDATYGDRPVAFVRGDLPDQWQVHLGKHLKRYEIPIEILVWPAAAEGAIKPDRKRLQRIANENE
ncbi:o-succinylbenzoate--CoA ligase [Mariniblastus sp.]|nr:o-succinylbenzoate--CoA ligase [Mariniblastus sp.]